MCQFVDEAWVGMEQAYSRSSPSLVFVNYLRIPWLQLNHQPLLSSTPLITQPLNVRSVAGTPAPSWLLLNN